MFFLGMIASSEGIIPRAKIKTVKVTLVIVSVFIACWAPYMVFDVLQVFGYVPNTQANVALATFIQSLAPLNSAANPLIYFIFSAHVFKTLRYVSKYKGIMKQLFDIQLVPQSMIFIICLIFCLTDSLHTLPQSFEVGREVWLVLLCCVACVMTISVVYASESPLYSPNETKNDVGLWLRNG